MAQKFTHVLIRNVNLNYGKGEAQREALFQVSLFL